MKIQIISDLHTEFFIDKKSLISQCEKILSPADWLIIAGDLGTSQKFVSSRSPKDLFNDALKVFCKHYERVIFVPGNHEYYHSTWNKTIEWFDSLENEFSSFMVLDNNVYHENEIQLIGSTLWFMPDPLNGKYWNGMSDSHFNSLKPFEERGEASARFIEDVVADPEEQLNDKICQIVVTHMVPLMESVPEVYKSSNLNRFFVNEKPIKLLEKWKENPEIWVQIKLPKIWIHGHTHTSFDYDYNGMRVICNPFGYWGTGDQNKEFDYQKIVEI